MTDEETRADLAPRVAALLAEHDPAATERLEFLARAVRRRAGLGALPRGSRRAGPAAGAAGRTSRPSSRPPAPPTTTRAGSASASGMAAPTILAFGTEEQKRRFLRPLWTGEEVWCQLFSEPGAGSDLAGAAPPAPSATATTGSSTGRRCGPPARTTPTSRSWSPAPTPTSPKHAGLTYFLCDMTRPRRRGPPAAADHRRGRVQRGLPRPTCGSPTRTGSATIGDGWKVATATLMNERVAIGGGVPRARAAWSASSPRAWREHPERRTPELHDRLLRLWVEAEVARLTGAAAAPEARRRRARARRARR